MAGSTGRHGRPDEPDDGTVAGEGAGVTPTQPLPMVRRDGPGQEPQPVRAVAKRVASALPALGRDEVSDLPPSARATADRRRRAREVADAETEPDAATDPGPEATRPQPEAEPEVELLPVGSRAREAGVPAAVASVEPPAPAGRHAAAVEQPPSAQPPTARHSSPDPEAPTVRPSPPPAPPPASSGLGPPEEPGHPRAIEAEVVAEAPRPYASTAAQTDEWVTVPPADPGPPPPPGSPLEPAGPVVLAAGPAEGALPRSRSPLPPVPPPGLAGRAGDADTWETTPLPPVAGEYEGRRRRDRRRGRRPTAAGWLVVLGVVVALSAAVAVPFLITGGARDGDRELTADPTTRTSATASATATVTAPATGLPVIPAPSVPPSPTVATSTQPADATTTEPVTQTSTTDPPALFSETLEAESGQRSGCATVSSVSGVTVVDRIGEDNDWPNCSRDGAVAFNNVGLPAGTFTVTVYYVFGQSNSDPSRRALLLIDRAGPGGSVDYQHNFPRTTSCCESWTTPTFTVEAGTFDIWFANPGLASGPDRAPALDRIVIQQQ